MTLYAETSAAASWLLGESPGRSVRELLDSASRIFASELTLVECDRAIRWATVPGRLSRTAASQARARLELETAHWSVIGLHPGILAGVRRDFPVEPVRSLDAIHLSTALSLRRLTPRLRILSLDRRVRDNAIQLGFEVLPARP